jgi:uncharacterized cupin superfamily protein
LTPSHAHLDDRLATFPTVPREHRVTSATIQLTSSGADPNTDRMTTATETTLQFNRDTLNSIDIPIADGAPPHVTLFGSPTIGVLHIAGPDEATGMVAIWTCDQDGFDYQPIPEPEAAFIIDGVLRVTPVDGDSFDVRTGEGYRLPAGWAGRIEAIEAVRKVYFLL